MDKSEALEAYSNPLNCIIQTSRDGSGNMNLKKITILHSNDIHGDFLAELAGQKGKLLGGLALLSGYINKVRSEEENALYVISGDMVQGSLIDAEYKGISTMEIMNYLCKGIFNRPLRRKILDLSL